MIKFLAIIFTFSTVQASIGKEIKWDILQGLKLKRTDGKSMEKPAVSMTAGHGGAADVMMPVPKVKKKVEKKEKKVAKLEKKLEKAKNIKNSKKKEKYIKKISKKLAKVLGKKINIKGFMLPLDYSAKKVKEFLLVPYIPSCMHVPPPPANQVIFVKMAKGKEAKSSYYPVDVKGKLSVEETDSDFMESTFKMEATELKEVK